MASLFVAATHHTPAHVHVEGTRVWEGGDASGGVCVDGSFAGSGADHSREGGQGVGVEGGRRIERQLELWPAAFVI
jgi:hypothetical protein